MATDLFDVKNDLSLREVLVQHICDGTEAGTVTMRADKLLDEVIEHTYQWLTGANAGIPEQREYVDVLAVLKG